MASKYRHDKMLVSFNVLGVAAQLVRKWKKSQPTSTTQVATKVSCHCHLNIEPLTLGLTLNLKLSGVAQIN